MCNLVYPSDVVVKEQKLNNFLFSFIAYNDRYFTPYVQDRFYESIQNDNVYVNFRS